MELAEDLLKKTAVCKTLEEKKVDMFPKEGQKVSSHAKEFLERLKKLRDDLTTLDNDINKEFDKYSGDVRYFAEYQTALQVFFKNECLTNSQHFIFRNSTLAWLMLKTRSLQVLVLLTVW